MLQKLEETFPEKPLQPKEPELQAELDEVIALADSLGRAGYRFMAGRDLSTANGRDNSAPPNPDELESFKSAFLAELERAEKQLGKHEGPFFLRYPRCSPPFSCCTVPDAFINRASGFDIFVLPVEGNSMLNPCSDRVVGSHRYMWTGACPAHTCFPCFLLPYA